MRSGKTATSDRPGVNFLNVFSVAAIDRLAARMGLDRVQIDGHERSAQRFRVSGSQTILYQSQRTPAGVQPCRPHHKFRTCHLPP
jgi:hypothetical protein